VEGLILPDEAEVWASLQSIARVELPKVRPAEFVGYDCCDIRHLDFRKKRAKLERRDGYVPSCIVAGGVKGACGGTITASAILQFTLSLFLTFQLFAQIWQVERLKS